MCEAEIWKAQGKFDQMRTSRGVLWGEQQSQAGQIFWDNPGFEFFRVKEFLERITKSALDN